MITLRPYQDELVSLAREAFNVLGYLRVLLVLATGGGKTIIFSFIAARQAAAGKRVWILAHRDELLTQISKSLNNFNVPHGVMRGGSRSTWHDVQVCSVQTLVRRLASGLPAPDLIVMDEAHHAMAGSWNKILAAYPGVPVLGVTATPVRMDGRGLGDVFNTMVMGPSPKWLTDHGYLSPADIYAPELADMTGVRTKMGDYDRSQVAERMDKPAIYGNAVHYYKQIAYGKRIIVFCVNLTHVQHTVDAYIKAGIPAAALDGKMTVADRAKVNADFEASRILVLVTCEIVNEGYDVPGCDGVQMLRPTQSLGLYLQQVGRGLRISPGKTRAIIIDHVANVGRMVNGVWVPKHGFPTDEREWDLNPVKKRSKSAGPLAPGVRMCMECYAIMATGGSVCHKCGSVIPVINRTPDSVDGELTKIAAPEPISKEDAERLMDSAVTLKDWHNAARRMGKSSGWAFVQYNLSRQRAVRAVAVSLER